MAAEYRRVAGAAKKGSEEQVAAAKLEQNALRKLSNEHQVHSRHLKDGTNELGKFTRGAAAGSGVLSHFGRSIAFASGAFLGAAGFTAILRQSIGAASDLHEQMTKTDVVFKSSAGTVKNWSKDSATAMGIARGEALKMAGTFGNMLVPMGFARGEAAKMSTNLVQLASDMASFNNADPAETLAALQSGLAGQVRPLRQFGVFLDQARIKAVALADGIVKPTVESRKLSQAQQAYALAQDKVTQAIAKHGPKSREAAAAELQLQKAADAVSKAMQGHVPALTAAQKALATYHIVLKDTKDAQGDFHRTSGGLANQTRILKAQLSNLEEELGTGLMPIILKYLPHLTAWIKKNEDNGNFQKDFNKAIKLGGEVVKGVVPIVKSIVQAWKDFSGAVGGSKHAIEILGAVFVGVKFGGAIIKATNYVKELRLALIALGDGEVLGVLGPLGLAVAAIIGAGAVIGIAGASVVPGTSGSMKVPGARVAAQRKAHPKAPIATGVDWDTKGNYQITYQDPQTGATRVQNATPQQAAKVLGISVGALNKKSGLGPSPDTGFRSANLTPGKGGTAGGVKWSGDYAGLNGGFKSKLEQCVAAAGGTSINVTSGRRSAAQNAAAGGASNSNHLTGHAADGTCTINGQSYPLGQAPINYGGFGLRAGSSFVWKGAPDIYHVDDGTNVGGDTGATTGGLGGATTFTEKPKPPKRVPVTVGTALLSADTRVALAQAATPTARRSALVQAREELEKLQKTASKAERVPIAEELGRINKQIQAIDVAAHRKKVAAIAKQTQEMTARVKAAIEAQKTAWAQHVQDLQQIADDAKTKFEDQWAKIADATLSKFDDATQRGMSKLQKDFAAQLDAFDRETARGLAALASPEQTPAEKLLADRAAKRQVDDDTQRVKDAQKALDDARAALGGGTNRDLIGNATTGSSTWTPPLDPNTTPEQAAASMKDLQDAVVQAQKDLDDALYQQQTDDLQTQADAERKAADTKAADDQAAYQTERDALRAHMEDQEAITETGYQNLRDTQRQNLEAWLNYQEQQLEAGKTQWSEFFKQLVALSGAYGLDAGAAWQAAWIQAGGAAGGVAAAAAAAAAAQGAGPALGAAGFGGFDANGNWVGGDINTIDMSGVPGFATGGIVGGPRPRSMDRRDTILARLRPGETIRTPEQEAALRNGGGSFGGTVIVNATVLGSTQREVEDAIAALAQAGIERRGPSIYMGR